MEIDKKGRMELGKKLDKQGCGLGRMVHWNSICKFTSYVILRMKFINQIILAVVHRILSQVGGAHLRVIAPKQHRLLA